MTCESLWMGVPVISLCGDRSAGRHSASLLTRVGLSDWVARTPQQYIALASALPQNLEQLAQLRSGLRERVLVNLCNAKRFTHGLENAYRMMWRRWCTTG